ncbi:hypothetical protein [Mobilicoccus caccae]|uniref:Ig-like domain-containing protein n=1 Tax=Mobilicoccus caccae TaxID=1859295 RepID=A0ABQ6INH2_9MICO|nr:hypothetical protein [Mobilicoccus caccae]GMA39455.1 hypothetical protein GCM10025883_15000 [Mobilicoccus caccae]
MSRSSGRLGVLLACLLLAACARPTTTPEEPAILPPVPTAFPMSTAPSAPATTGVDVIPEAIRSAPAACGLPEHHLTGYKSRSGDTHTVLQVTEGYNSQMAPVAPVRVDITGDGALDLVGVLSCTVAGQPRPDHLVLYTGPAMPAAALDLSTVQDEKLAVVRALRTVGGEVRVEWTGFDDPAGRGTQYQGTVSWTDGALTVEDEETASGPRTVTVDTGTFMTSDGNVHCVMHPTIAWCDVSQTTWRPPPSPAPTSPAPQTPTSVPSDTSTTTGAAPSPTATEQGCGDRPYGRTFLLNQGRAIQTCAGEQGPELAALGSALTSWHRLGWDATVTVDGRRSAAMTPGSSMQTQGIECRASADQVTCTDTRTQAAFTVGRTTARVSSG